MGEVAGTIRDTQGNAIPGAVVTALDPRPEWAAEGAAFTAWRSAVWSFVYDWLARVQAGNAAPPEDAAALVAALPPMVWP